LFQSYRDKKVVGVFVRFSCAASAVRQPVRIVASGRLVWVLQTCCLIDHAPWRLCHGANVAQKWVDQGQILAVRFAGPTD
jgi:hypothetical protein